MIYIKRKTYEKKLFVEKELDENEQKGYIGSYDLELVMPGLNNQRTVDIYLVDGRVFARFGDWGGDYEFYPENVSKLILAAIDVKYIGGEI